MHVVESNINSSLDQKVISRPDSFKIFLEKVCVNVNILEKVCVNVNYQVLEHTLADVVSENQNFNLGS